MKVGIIGYGFVGKALRKGLKDNVKCIEIDPKLNTNIDDLIKYKPDIVFICLPTPMNDDGTQNIKILKSDLYLSVIVKPNPGLSLSKSINPFSGAGSPSKI